MGNACLCNHRRPRLPVHPHVHGERSAGCPLRTGHNGSSPRAWGTHKERVEEGVDNRFIPTCMGNAGSLRHLPSTAAVHPHVHGERWAVMAYWTVSTGSSPRAWGTLTDLPVPNLLPRFIPTCMGNASAERRGFLPVSVHPHVHGERFGGFVPLSTVDGSSPRAWGTLR